MPGLATLIQTILGSLGEIIAALLLLFAGSGCALMAHTDGAAKWEVYCGVRSEQVSPEKSEAGLSLSPDLDALDLAGSLVGGDTPASGGP